MKKAHVVLADPDQDYVSIFELRFLEKYGDIAELQVISDRDYFDDFFSHPQELTVLIVNEHLYSEGLARHKIQAVIKLSEESRGRGQDQDGGHVLYKYSPIKSVFAEMAPYMGSSEGNGSTQVICVYSPSGGVGTTTVAIGLAGALANHHKRVLYLDTQPLQSSQAVLKDLETASGELRAAILSGGEDLLPMLEKYHVPGAFDYLPPMDHVTTVYGIGVEHYRKLLAPIKKANVYDYLVVDCSSDFTQEKSRLISECDKVIVVSDQSAAACWKVNALFRDISVRNQDQFLFFCNKYRSDEPDHSKSIALNRVANAGYLAQLSEDACEDPQAVAKALTMLVLCLL